MQDPNKINAQRTQLKEVIRRDVYQYREQPITLASGRRSHHYFNCKNLTMRPAGLALLMDVVFADLKKIHEQHAFSKVAGMTMGPDPLLYGLGQLALAQNDPHVWLPLVVRKQAKDHGTGRQVEGDFQAAGNVLLIDDVITTAGSSIQALVALRKEKQTITDLYCILDRQEGGLAALEKEGVRLHYTFQKSDFIEPGAKDDGYLNP